MCEYCKDRETLRLARQKDSEIAHLLLRAERAEKARDAYQLKVVALTKEVAKIAVLAEELGISRRTVKMMRARIEELEKEAAKRPGPNAASPSSA